MASAFVQVSDKIETPKWRVIWEAKSSENGCGKWIKDSWTEVIWMVVKATVYRHPVYTDHHALHCTQRHIGPYHNLWSVIILVLWLM